MNEAPAAAEAVGDAPTLGPTAERLATELRASAGARTTATLEELEAAYDTVQPALASAPGRRRRVGELIGELAAAGVIVPSRKQDRREAPALPAFVRLTGEPPPGRLCAEARTYPWRPELRWAAELGVTESEFATLEKVHAFLRDGGARRPEVPAPERSLEMLGHEKELERVRHTRLWGEDRLSYALLRCRRVAAPFSVRAVGEGSWLLVAENEASAWSLAEALDPRSPVGLVAFGGGGLFRKSVEWAVELPAALGRSAIGAIRYVGDLDAEGLRIPIAASAVAEEAGLPPVRPAIALYARMLRDGRREPRPALDPEVAADLAAWFPPPLAREVEGVLTGGARIAQEHVGLEWLAAERHWWSAVALGPGRHGAGVALTRPADGDRQRTTQAEGEDEMDGIGQLAGPWAAAAPSTPPVSVAASATRNWLLGDPLLDWLARYGAAAGFVPDPERPGYDARTDFRAFVLEQGIRFEAGVLTCLEALAPITRIPHPSRDEAGLSTAAAATRAALERGDPFVAGGVLLDPVAGVHGIADLLVRSDVLALHWPESIGPAEAAVGVPGLGLRERHYRVVEVKFHRFALRADGSLAGGTPVLPYAAQAWLYNEALGRLQGYLPSAAYLLGRGCSQGDDRGDDALERFARVDAERDWQGVPLGELAGEAVRWVRRVRAEGAAWHVLPEPSVPELYPHARHADDAPWHGAKAEIAAALGELTLPPRMTPRRRAIAHAVGVRRYDDPALNADLVGLADWSATLFEAVRAANTGAGPMVLPARIERAGRAWAEPAPLEFYVDLETVSDLDDDFAALPCSGGQPLVFQVGCGLVAPDGTWSFAQWTADALAVAEERRILDAWFAHLAAVCTQAGVALADARVCHWSPAETAWIDGGAAALVAARRRHPDADWPALPWFDVLDRVVRAEPVTVSGAFGFGLKPVARAMHRAGLVPTVWGDGPTDGLGAMVGAWRAAAEARAQGIPLSAHPLMREIAAYNEVDCCTMADVLAWLRANR